MKKRLIICLLIALASNAWASSRSGVENYKVNNRDYMVDPVVAETLFHRRNTGLHTDSYYVIVDMIDQALDRNDVASARKLLATIRAFDYPTADEFKMANYEQHTKPVLINLNFPFGQGGGGFPPRDFPTK